MRFEGSFEVGADPVGVFQVVTDPTQISGCMPDLQKVEVKSPELFDAVVRVGVGFIKGDFKMEFRVTEKRPPSSARMVAHGSGLGSLVDIAMEVGLNQKGRGTAIKWTAEATVSGRIASLGQRLMQSNAERMIDRFFDCFRERLERA